MHGYIGEDSRKNIGDRALAGSAAGAQSSQKQHTRHQINLPVMRLVALREGETYGNLRQEGEHM